MKFCFRVVWNGVEKLQKITTRWQHEILRHEKIWIFPFNHPLLSQHVLTFPVKIKLLISLAPFFIACKVHCQQTHNTHPLLCKSTGGGVMHETDENIYMAMRCRVSSCCINFSLMQTSSSHRGKILSSNLGWRQCVSPLSLRREMTFIKFLSHRRPTKARPRRKVKTKTKWEWGINWDAWANLISFSMTDNLLFSPRRNHHETGGKTVVKEFSSLFIFDCPPTVC